MNCISLFSICGSCFPNPALEKSLIEIENIFQEIKEYKNVSNPKKIQLERDFKKQELEKAYQIALDHFSECGKTTPDKMLAYRLGEILKEYGRLHYEESFTTCRVILEAALNLQLYSIGVVKKCINLKEFETLEELKIQASVNTNLFDFMDTLILDLDQRQCLKLIYNKKYSLPFIHKQMHLMASTLRWLGHCHQNINVSKESNPKNDRRFEQIYYLCEALLLPCTNETLSKQELAEYHYNTGQFLHLRKHPEDYVGACQTYEKALELDPSPEMRARVANMRSLFMNAAKNEEMARKYQKEALDIRTSLPETEQSAFLYANLRNNYAAFLLDQVNPNYEEAEKYLNMAIKYSTASRNNNTDQHYFAFYDFNLARVLIAKDNLDEAEKCVKRAVETLKKYPECNADSLLRADKLFELIHEKRKVS